MNSNIKKYPSYKNAGVEWLGEIPEHWEILPGFTVLKERREKNIGMIENTVLSLSYGNVIVKPIEKLTGLVPESFETYQIVYPTDIIVRPTDLQNDKTSLRTGIAKNKGIITSAYLNLRVKEKYSPFYFYYFLHALDITKIIYGLGSGLRQNLSFVDFKRFPFIAPPLQEQTKIAQFLDQKTTQIDQAITQKEQLIQLLKERRKIMIQQAVTKGLNPDVPMRDSGVEWIGEIPEHWEVKKLKFMAEVLRGKFTHRPRNDERFYNGQYPFIQTGDISGTSKYINSFKQTLNHRGFNVSKEFPKGTVVLTITGSNTGEVAILNFNACFPDSIVGFFPITKTSKQFLYYSLYSLRNVFLQSSTKSTQMNINLESVSNQYITVPPFLEQNEISEFIINTEKKIFDTINNYLIQIQKLKEYKSTLINSAVTGKIKI